MGHALIDHYSEADYLAAEVRAEVKHEYIAGEVFAMAGASKVHGTLAGNAFIALRQRLRDQPCGVWMADMKVRVRQDAAYYYPDVVVTCAAADLAPDAPREYLEAPSLVLEVLADSTESFDRREKLLSYRRLESLQEYALVDQNKPWVEVYRRSPTGWIQDIYGPGDSLRLDSVDLVLPMADLYADTGLLAEPVASPEPTHPI